MLLNPFGHTWKILVLLADVILFAQVDEIDDWLCREKEERVDELDLEKRISTTSSKISRHCNDVCDLSERVSYLRVHSALFEALSTSWVKYQASWPFVIM